MKRRHACKVADNADALNNIFTEISEEIVSSAGYPTQIEKPSGDPVDGTDDGYITFTDRLGDYMEVDGFKTIVFASQRFDLKAGGKTTDGNTDASILLRELQETLSTLTVTSIP